mmetsp:Transcript_19909/g.9263  ORF Transcript_19909/g.9263 Transcript_19909/m.9263 type:complete len:722 (+) Transcript_19909:1070-3235(+)
MNKPLIIVESPTKVRTIKKYIGKDFDVAATVGHIRDLPKKELGIDIDNDFKLKYKNIEGKQKVIKSLKSAAANVNDIYLAPDPDREGEAIAWHTAEILRKKGRQFHRILFYELTKDAILKAVESPGPLSKHKYDAQQVRRILDRLVGYQISPLLWRKVKGGLSAGRVQSVTVRIICERERAIYAFESEEYWSITALLEEEKKPSFDAKLVKKDGKKIKIPDKEASDNILDELSKADFFIDKIIKKTKKQNPLPPFITSKLQQEAIQKLRFSAKKTMVIAQQLYEGIDLGEGPIGLITYMRTDSTRISKEAAEEAIQYVVDKFGKDYAMAKPRFFANKKNKIQDAHESIRPTSVLNTPEKVASFLSKEQLKLYILIWKRFVASQMQQALIDQKSVHIKADKYTFTASGSSIKFPGFMALYESSGETIENSKKSKKIPELSEGVKLNVLELKPKQHFTLPPPRFSEATLVKELEENGIGRPSTYAAILSTIRAKGYVELQKGCFRPSELGFIVNDLLVVSFPEILDVDFTAKMEDNLDKVEEAKLDFIKILKKFYSSFNKALKFADTKMLSIKGVGISTDLKCPECNSRINIKVGKNGPFLTCNAYPKCKYARSYIRDEKGSIAPVNSSAYETTDKTCSKCGKQMIIKNGRYGEFLACSGYPDCKNTMSLNSAKPLKKIGIKCQNQGCDGEIVERRSKRGKIFYGCSKFPDCSFATWNKPGEK